jgi:hypothetical protein
LYLSPYIERLDTVAEVCDGGVCWVVGTKNLNGFLNTVIGVNIINCDDCKCFVVTRIAESNASAGNYAETFYIRKRHIKGDRDGEKRAISQS